MAKIKPIDWRKDETWGGPEWTGVGICYAGKVAINRKTGKYVAEISSRWVKSLPYEEFDKIEDAQAAVQRDFDIRMNEWIEP